MRGPLTTEEVTFGETTFTFRRAMPIEAFNIFERLRPGLASISDTVRRAYEAEAEGKDRSANFLSAAIEMVGKLPQETVTTGMKELMKHVLYSRPNADGTVPAPAVVANDMGSAFKGLTIFQMYELLVRAFAVNFSESFSDLRSLFQHLQSEE